MILSPVISRVPDSLQLKASGFKWKCRRYARRDSCRCLAWQAPWRAASDKPTTPWRVRGLRGQDVLEVAAAADLQATCFHEPPPLGFLKTWSLYLFRADVISIITAKLKYTTKDEFKCLVVPAQDPSKGFVGIIELSKLSDEKVLRAIPEPAPDYLCYLACMAVDARLRRQGIATALLAAAQVQAAKWRMKWMALDVFADNATALACYEACGFKIIRRDEPMRRLIGQRLRVTMAKPV
ncbi:hypothetical protein WJX74_001754 [Apatococcus lobatus]|uniref:N-acetyltransferase domain-containing protein n=1 Tax=Apatococcus lobatus TaxID=904363 RepID=A0AAW1SAD2_9CHLO